MAIKNIIFDIGNVLLRWDPYGITVSMFPEHSDKAALAMQLFKSQTWFDLNLGKINEQQAIEQYYRNLNIEMDQLKILMQVVKESLLPIEGSLEILAELHQNNFPLYALTDNTKEIVAYLQKKYHFWNMFRGIVVSAEIGHLKPSPEIYLYLLENYKLNAHETLFIDDYLPNVEGAKAVGISAFQFENAKQCLENLNEFGVFK